MLRTKVLQRQVRRRQVRLGVIGCGYWGPNLARNFNELPDSVVSYLCDVDPRRLEHLCNLYPLAGLTTDYRDVLQDPEVDAVVVATPVRTHYPLAREALLAGKHVLVEKPIATSAPEARELCALARERGLVLMVGHVFKYNAAVEGLRDLIARGDIGRVYYAYSTRVNLGLYQKDVNVMWDLAPHDISILMFLLGERPAGVSARGSFYVKEGIHDVVYLTLDFPGHVLAHLHVSWLDPCKVRRLTVVGSEKMVVYDDLEPLEKLKVYDKSVGTVPYTESFGDFQFSYRYGPIHIPHINFTEPLKVECTDFLNAILAGQPPRCDGEDGLHVVQVLEAAQASLQEGGARKEVAW